MMRRLPAGLIGVGCASAQQSAFEAAGPHSRSIASLGLVFLALLGAIFVIVIVMVVTTTVTALLRRLPAAAAEQAQWGVGGG